MMAIASIVFLCVILTIVCVGLCIIHKVEIDATNKQSKAYYALVVFLSVTLTAVATITGIDLGREWEAHAILIDGKSNFKVEEIPGKKIVVPRRVLHTVVAE